MKRKIGRILVLLLTTVILAVTVEKVETIWPANLDDQHIRVQVKPEYLPNDPNWTCQWGPKKIEADWAWNATLGNSSVLVAVVDSGVDYTHPDLAANYVGLGYDWAYNDTDPIDDWNHGTFVAGIIAAVTNNSEGIAGLAQVKVMAEKVWDKEGVCYLDWLANGIKHAVDKGAQIISMSWSVEYNYSLLYDAVKYAYEKNVLLVAAAGNEENDTKRYPAAYDEVIAVTATDQNDNPAWFSNFGDWVELAAPGVDIYSTIRGPSYDYWSGTSFACPHVSGLAALVWSEFPNATRDWIRTRLRETADDLGDPGFDIHYGYGRINARKAIYGNFPAVNYTLTITTATGGTTNPPPGNYTYSQGQNIPVQAIPNSGYGLDHWELDGINVGSANPYSVLMDNNHTLQAVFVLRYWLTITTTTGGTTNPSPGSYFYNVGTNVSVTARPDIYYIFDRWELDGVNIGSTNPYPVLMDNNHTLQAVFAQINYTLTITATAGGTTSPVPDIYTYAAGSSIQITAIPNTDYTLDYWELDGINIGTTNPISLTMDRNYTLQAVFRVGLHDIAIVNIKSSKTVVGQGYSMNINVTITNQGDYPETFNVTLYANTTEIGTQEITLASGSFTTLTFTWNTTGFAKGNYTIWAYAWPVRGETDTADNTFNNSWVIVAMVGDLTGPNKWPDGKVDMRDIGSAARLFGVSFPDPYYNPNFDIDNDLKIDMKDIAEIAKQFGKIDP